MRRTLASAAAGAVVTAFMGVAQAVPIYFDFTGTMTGNSATSIGPDGNVPATEGYSLGGSISGGFTFETDRLYPSDIPPNGRIWVDWQPVDPAEPLAFLSFGGRDVSLPQYTGLNYTDMSFGDNCTPDGCPPGINEGFSLFASSADQPFIDADFTGTFRTSSVMVFSTAETRVPDFPYYETFDYFDLSAIDPYSIVTLPLYETLGLYVEETDTCVSGSCTYSNLTFSFSLDSVTRGVGPRAIAVPEPDTLGLFAAAGAGFLLFGRRRRPATHAQFQEERS